MKHFSMSNVFVAGEEKVSNFCENILSVTENPSVPRSIFGVIDSQIMGHGAQIMANGTTGKMNLNIISEHFEATS